MLARFVAEATDNKFQIQPFAAGELATSRQALDVVTSGSVECAHTPLSFHTAKDMTLGLGTGLPFGLNARHQQSWWSHGGGAEVVNAALKRFGALGLPAGTVGPQMGGWFKKEIHALDDLKGLRFRINGLGAPVFARIGAVPFEMPHADVVAALESTAIDGAEFWESAGMVHLVVNLEKWNALPGAYKAVLARACDAVSLRMLAKYDAVNPPALRRLIAAGAQIKPFPQPVLEACFRAAAEHFAEVAAKDPLFKKGMDSVAGFLKDRLRWLQVSDHAFDALQIAINGRA
jgi:TRAP-type mannitol/chloroaromatic compound transport system substrate-binding protein